ncbi:MAG: replication-associated recombination protein A [Oscillospiraceae bacterium]|jgi:putative ATPase|nr:replication-associated recombination protein A [Oscillospiraceae bacterium]
MSGVSAPLPDRIRPVSFDDIVGQSRLLGPGGLLRRIVENGHIPNMVFHGPPGTGKTTAAGIIAEKTSRTLHRLNATTAGIADIKAITDSLDTLLTPCGALVYLDEIQYFNKKQQQSLLEFMENGKITLIASTTENPYFYVYGAVLSRASVFEFTRPSPEEIAPAVRRAFRLCAGETGGEVTLEDGVAEYIARACGGDVRKAVTAAELLAAAAPLGAPLAVSLQDAAEIMRGKAATYDRDGDGHYDILSAYQKSLRGSDPDAAVHYLGRLLEAGDMASACRRLLVCACEDVGLAYPQIIPIVKSCVDSAERLGLPEARIPLACGALLVATSPKSNSAVAAIDAALADIREGGGGEIPAYLKDGNYEGAKKLGRAVGYKYPHDFPDNYTQQQYLPDALRGREYYTPGENKAEQTAERYWEIVRKNTKPQ